MVGGSADRDRVLFEVAVAGSGLAGVEHERLRPLQRGGILRRSGGDAAQALQKVQRGPFRNQQPAGGSVDLGEHVTVFTMVAILSDRLELQPRLHQLEHPFRHRQSGKHHTGLLAEQHRLGGGVLRHDRIGGYVAGGVEILAQRKFNQQVGSSPVNGGDFGF